MAGPFLMEVVLIDILIPFCSKEFDAFGISSKEK
jgi:hypothetical protein